jgi:prepilin-type processing-associated H-X9-DG protein
MPHHPESWHQKYRPGDANGAGGQTGQINVVYYDGHAQSLQCAVGGTTLIQDGNAPRAWNDAWAKSLYKTNGA